MTAKLYKPYTKSRRFISSSDFSELTKKKPEKSLIKSLKKTGGRNSNGRITSFHRGGGHKRRYREVDFRRIKKGIAGKVLAIEYDPNRTSWIALISYKDGQKQYVIAPEGLKKGDIIVSDLRPEINIGNSMPLKNIPAGSSIHNVELKPGGGGKIARSAGSMVRLLAKEAGFAHLKMPSGEVRIVSLDCIATMGQVSNSDHANISLGNAGRSRHLGRRPHVRGNAMNPIDHPHGGGEGKMGTGRNPVTPWGKPTKGHRTRNAKKQSSKQILKRR